MTTSSALRLMLAGVLAATTLSARAASETFTGTISDGICALDGHASMRMGPTDEDCARACVDEHDGKFVLVSGATVYALSDQKAAEKFAAGHVAVTGTLDAATKTIQVEKIARAD